MEFLTSYKDQVILVASFFMLPVFAFFISLGTVFLLGRMLAIVKSDRAKNLAAFLSIVAVYLFYFWKVDNSLSVIQRVWYGVIYSACSIILYVIIGFKLYDRFDDFLDRRFGKDRPTKVVRQRKKTRGL